MARTPVGFKRLLMRERRPALTESEHVSRCATSVAREPRSQLLAVSQAKSARNAARRRRFPRSAEPTANDPRRKPHRSPDPWRNRRPLPAKPPRSRGGATAGKAAATVAPARAQPEASRGTPAGEAAAADEHAGMLIGSICAYSQTNACTGCTANHRTKALMESGKPPVRTRLAHLAQRAPLADVHARCRAALYAPGPHVAPGGVAVGRHRKPPDRKRLRQSSGNESKSQPEASRKRYRQRLLSHKQICRHYLSREEERF